MTNFELNADYYYRTTMEIEFTNQNC